jgi:hypothetical protein
MHLLSRAYHGKLRFLVADESNEPAKIYSCYSEPGAGGLGLFLLPPPPVGHEVTREIVLHHCTYRGGSAVNNHENALHYKLTDGTMTKLWSHLLVESPEMRSARQSLLVAASATSAEVLSRNKKR